MLAWLSALLVLVASSLYFPFHSNSRVLSDDTGFHGQEANASRILLLTAHPDDECLFFAPTLLALRQDPTHLELYSLTMSVGNADGMGEARRVELSHSLDTLGVDYDKRWVVDHPMLQDNITLQWDASVIAIVIAPYVVNNHINTILTFDGQGVSSHPNHCALSFGVRNLVSTLRSRALETSVSVPRIFELVTVPVVSKYTGALGLLSARLSMILDHFTRNAGDQRAVFTSGFKEYTTSIQAMRQHASQLLWFRYLYVLFSRYMWVNEWVEIDVVESKI